MLRRLVFLLFLTLAAGGARALAQTQLGTGAVTGVVKDGSDAVVANARVEAINAATGLRRLTTAGPAGTFAIPVLPTGTYTLSVSHEGFATWKADAVEVNVGGSTSVAVTLQPQTVQEIVTVGATLAVDTVKTDESS